MKRGYFIGLSIMLMLGLVGCAVAAPSQTESNNAESVKEMQTEQSETINVAKVLNAGVDADTEAKSVTVEPAADAQTTETGPTAAQMQILSSLPNHGPAPELLNDTFLNSDVLTLAELRGKVVIVEFWTYG